MSEELSHAIRATERRFILVSGLLFVLGCLLAVSWNSSVKRELAELTVKFIRRGIQSGDRRAVLYTISRVNFEKFHAVALYGNDQQRIVTLPASAEAEFIEGEGLWNQFLYQYLDIPMYFDSEQKLPMATVRFIFGRFSLVVYAVVLWSFAVLGFVPTYFASRKKVVSQFWAELKLREEIQQAELARKIRHNIRSPLAVLGYLFSQSHPNSNWTRQGQQALARIDQIVSEVSPASSQTRSRPELKKPLSDLRPLLRWICEEKQIQSMCLQISPGLEQLNEPLYVDLPASELKAAFSNLIDNAQEASAPNSSINIHISHDSNLVVVDITDHGVGMNEEVLAQVCKKGFTHGKAQGSGLGLYYAKMLLIKNGGNIELTSKPGRGTTVRLMLPRRATPSWHFERLELCQDQTIWIVEDQATIADLWHERLRACSPGLRIEVLDISTQLPRHGPPTFVNTSDLCLIDYDLGPEKDTGLALIQKWEIASQSVLVTGHFDDPELQLCCDKHRIRLLAKSEIATLPILIQAPLKPRLQSRISK